MRHGNIDQHARASSFFSLDPRAKILAIIFCVVIVALLRDLIPLIISLSLALSILIISNIPLKHIVKRYLIAFPFAVFASLSLLLYSGLWISLAMFLRVSTCVLLLILLSSTTPFFDLLKASQRLKVPKLIIVLCMFLYRYIFVMNEEYQRMKMARKARGFKGGKHLFDGKAMHVISSTAGMVLIRSYNRGVRIYDALLSRGYDGEIRTLTELRFKKIDYAFAMDLMLFSAFILWMDWLVIS